MSTSLKSYWVNRVELTPVDRKRLSFFIGEELKYYNALVSAFAGPIRSMPETFARSEPLQGLLLAFAERAEEPSKLRSNRLPAVYEPYKAVLFDERSRLILDERMQFIANTLATPATLDLNVRRNIAKAVLRESRRQSKALTESANTDTGAMPTIIEALLPIASENRRHVQLPRESVKVVEDGKHELVLKLPYFAETVKVSKPNATWNYVYVRVDHDSSISIDLAFEEAEYGLRKADRAPQKARKERS